MDLEKLFEEIFKRSGKFEKQSQEKYKKIKESCEKEDGTKQAEIFLLLQKEQKDWSQGILRDFFDC